MPANLTDRSADPDIPDTPAGRRLGEFLGIVNAGDYAATRSYVEAHFDASLLEASSLADHVRFCLQTHDLSRGCVFHRVKRSEAHEIVAVVRFVLSELWHEIAVHVTPEPPHKIQAVMISPAAPPADAPPLEKLSDGQMVERLEAYTAKLAEAEVFSGTVLLAREGKPLFEGAYGLASRAFGVPNKVDTKLNLGSLNKMFTGVTIAQLAEQGRLSFDDPVSRHLPARWLKTELAQKVQVCHLLTHTSGLGSFFNETYWQSSKTLYRSIDDFQALVAEETLAFEPGTQWQYSNTGFLLLGAIVEAITNESYFDYVGEHIYRPAGMVNTDAYEMDRPVPNLAMGYDKEYTAQGIRWRNNLFAHVIKGGPAGGGFSTVRDLLCFANALLSYKLLSPEYTEMVLTAKPEINSPEYGFGFHVSKGKAGRVVGHLGGFVGINARLNMYLDLGYTVVVLANYSPPAAGTVAEAMRGMISA